MPLETNLHTCLIFYIRMQKNIFNLFFYESSFVCAPDNKKQPTKLTNALANKNVKKEIVFCLIEKYTYRWQKKFNNFTAKVLIKWLKPHVLLSSFFCQKKCPTHSIKMLFLQKKTINPKNITVKKRAHCEWATVTGCCAQMWGHLDSHKSFCKSQSTLTKNSATQIDRRDHMSP